MKTLLIFPPFASPTFIPYHLCDLIGYIKTRNPKLEIDLWDWNIELFNRNAGNIKNQVKSVKEGESKSYFYNINQIITHWSEVQDKYNRLATEYMKRQKNQKFELLIESYLESIIDKYDAIGFSLTFHQKDDISQFYMTIATSMYIKSRYPDKKIILGGALLNHIDPLNLLKSFYSIDYILVKESEESFFQLLTQLSSYNLTDQEKQIKTIPNLRYRIQERVISNDHKNNIKSNLEYLPEIDNIKLNDYLISSPAISIQYKRGCPWNRCSFCSQNISYMNYQKDKCIDNFAKKLNHLISNGVKHFYIADQMITPNDIEKILAVIEKNKICCNWTLMAMPGKKFTPELLNRMYSLGCSWITWGIESGSQAILKKMNKPININIAKENIINAHFAGIKNVILMIYAFPGETLDDFNHSLNFLEGLKPYYYDNSMSPYHLCYGSPMHNHPEYFGIKILDALPIYSHNDILINSNIYRYESSHPLVDYSLPTSKQSIPFAEHMLLFSSQMHDLKNLK